MKVSVIVPTWNHVDRLPALFESLSRQTALPHMEVVVINDGSSDSTRPWLVSYQGALPLTVVHQVNQGTAGARHRGAAEASGDVLLFLDDDMFLPADFVAAHRRAHLQERVVVAGRVFNIHPDLVQPALTRLQAGDYGSVESFRTHDPLVDLGETFAQELGSEYVPWVACIGGNFSIRKADYAAAGGYDLGFRGWGPEDVEMTYRLSRLGLRFRYVREAVSYHLDHVAGQKGQLDQVFERIKYFYTKHSTPEVAAYVKYATGKLSWDKFCKALTGVTPVATQHEFDGRHMIANKTGVE